MTSRITGILLGLAALILAAFCIAQQSELRAIRAEITRLRTPAAAGPSTAVTAAAESTAPDSVVGQPASTNAATGAGVRAKKIRIKKRAHSEMTELMKDPKRKKFMEAVWTLQMDTVYGPLFRYYEMTSDELQYFQSLLTEKMLSAQEFAARRMEADKEGAADIRKQEEQVEGQLKSQIREFLGNEAYEEFERYEKCLPDRMMLKEFGSSLSLSGSPLNDVQEGELIRIMYEERQNLPLLRQLTENNGWDGSLESLPTDRVMQEFEQGSSRMIMRARQALTPAQFESFTNYVGQLRDMIEVGVTVQSAAGPAADGGGTQK